MVAVALVIADANAALACLRLGQPATLTGTVFRQIFPGPPGYESLSDGDRPETALMLVLDAEVCATDEAGHRLASAFVQLVAKDDHQYDQLNAYRGSQLTVTGDLFEAETGHHHAPLLIEKLLFPPR
jgi:hypothetical protein